MPPLTRGTAHGRISQEIGGREPDRARGDADLGRRLRHRRASRPDRDRGGQVLRHAAEERAPGDHLRGSRRAGLRHRRQLQRRIARRAEGADRLRPPVRAHDVQGIRERRPRRAPVSDLLERRLDERDDQQGSHPLLRDPAGQPARSRALPRGRSDAVARDHRGEPGQPAPGGAGGAPARRRQPAVRQDVRGPRRARLRELRLRAFGDRLDGGSERGDGRRRGVVLQDLLRPQQRGAQHRRRRRHEDDAGEGAALLRVASRRSRRPRPWT